VITFVIFALFMALILFLGLDAAGGDIGLAFYQADTVLRIIAILGMISGVFILLYPGSLPYPSWRSTLVIGVSIPLSILSALALMRWFPLTDGLTLNIMTLSGLTVAVGRVVDDSIVVLENIFRQIQTGMDKKEAILSGVRDVSVAIFSATSIAVVVFLPLGLTGGIIGEFFLPFGLAVTYALLSSFLVAITVIPALAYIFISADDVPEESETWMQKLYVPSLKVALGSGFMRWTVVILAVLSAGFGAFLLGSRPAAFLPDFGEPRINVAVEMPEDFNIIQTNELVVQMEAEIVNVIGADNISTVSTTVGGGGLGFEALFGGGGVSENQANIEVGLVSQDLLETYNEELRVSAESIFGEDNVSVSASTIASGGFGGFELVASAPNQEILEQYDAQIIETLNSIDGITNVSSNLAEAALGGANGVTYIRSNQSPAASYTGELETDDTIGITSQAIEAIETQLDLPDDIVISQGFDSEVQTEGFQGVFVAMGLAIVIVVAILILVFQSPIYWLAVIFSIVVAPVGAAVALTLTDRVLGISALIGLLMLLGLVVTNAVVLIDRVGSNRFERNMNLYDALIEAGSRRVRPILMTALATIIALIPLAVGLSDGAIIASELGTVVIGGVFSSTFLTLMVVPAAYYIFTPIHDFFMRLIGRNRS
jgi:HAE1 family hydrophobic/amphiphilic exporter-1